MLEDSAIQAKADAKAKKWEAGEPQRAEHRAQQEAEDAAYAATLPQHVEDLTEEHVTAMMNKGKGDPKWFLTQDMAKKYINQYNATDTVGRKTSAPVKPKILQALHNTAIYGTPPASSRQVLDKVHAAGDAVDVMTGFPAGDLSMLGEAAVTGNKPMAAMAGAGLALPGAAGVAAKSSLGKKLGDKTLSYLGDKASDPALRQRLAQGVQDRTGKLDDRLDVGSLEPAGHNPKVGKEDLRSVQQREAVTETVHDDLKDRKWYDHYQDENKAIIETYEEDILIAINQIFMLDDTSLSRHSQEYIDLLVSKGMSKRKALLRTYNDRKLYTISPGEQPYRIEHSDLMQLANPQTARNLEKSERAYGKNVKAMEGVKERIVERKMEMYDFERFKGIVTDADRAEYYDYIHKTKRTRESGSMSPTAARASQPHGKTDQQFSEMQDKANDFLAANKDLIQVSPPVDGPSMIRHMLAEGHYSHDPVLESIATKLSQNPMLDKTVVINTQPTTYKNTAAGHHRANWRTERKDRDNLGILPNPNVVAINSMTARRGAKRGYPETLLHELTHSVTVAALTKGEALERALRDTKLPDGDLIKAFTKADHAAHGFFNEIEDLMFQVEQNQIKLHGKTGELRTGKGTANASDLYRSTGEKFKHGYGMLNAFEFVAEANSNADFRKILKETLITTPEGTTLSLFDKFITMMANLLKVEPVELDALFKTIDSMRSYDTTRKAVLEARTLPSPYLDLK